MTDFFADKRVVVTGGDGFLGYYVCNGLEKRGCKNILVPKIMQKTVGLNPIISIAALMIGFKIAGIVGAILSIPVATAVSVFVKDLFDSKGVKEREIEN